MRGVGARCPRFFSAASTSTTKISSRAPPSLHLRRPATRRGDARAARTGGVTTPAASAGAGTGATAATGCVSAATASNRRPLNVQHLGRPTHRCCIAPPPRALQTTTITSHLPTFATLPSSLALLAPPGLTQAGLYKLNAVDP